MPPEDQRPEVEELVEEPFGQRPVPEEFEGALGVEAAELLEAALPVLRETSPSLVGPAAWALGNALIGLGQWAPGRTAFATASTAFEGVLAVGLGVRGPGAVRVRSLTGPSRLVVDVAWPD